VLGAFGPWGAVLGAAAGALGALASSMGLFGGSAKEATNAAKELNDQLGVTDGLARAAAAGYDALIQKVKESTRAKREGFLAQLAIDAREAEKELKETAVKVGAAMGDVNAAVAERISVLFGNAAGGVSAVGQEINKLQAQIAQGVATPETYARFNKLVREGGVVSAEATERARTLQAEIKRLTDIIESGNATPDQYLQLATILRDLAANAVPELAEKLRAQADNLALSAGNTEKHNEKLAEIKATIAAVNGATDDLTRKTLNSSAAMTTATGSASGYADAIRSAVRAMNSLSDAKPEFAIPQPMSFSGSPSRPSRGIGQFGQTFGKLDPSALLSEPAWVDSDEINKAIKPLNVLGLGFAKVVPEAKEFTDSIRAAEASVVDLSKAPKTFTIGGGGINFKGLPSRTDVLGQLFGNENPADMEMSRFASEIYGNGGVIKPKKAAKEKVTPEDRAEDRTQALKDEIAFNQQLALVYDQGVEARNRVTASYLALKEARKTGLAEGSDEFKQFVEIQTKQNEVNLGLEHRLDLMKQGQTLHESLMTDQERENKLLADYKEMLDAGALSFTDYQRAVAKAKDNNEQLIEAIDGVGDAIESGIQGATSFSDALTKIGLQLLSMIAKGAFGAGPLGGLFNSLLNVGAGGILGLAGGGAGAAGAAGAAASIAPGFGTGFQRSFAAGGMGGPGPVLVGESGPEIANMPARGYIAPANATRRLLSPTTNGQPMQIVVNGAKGNQEIMRMISAGVSEGVRQAGKNVPSIQRNYNLRFAP
jgi:hypothetical protein